MLSTKALMDDDDKDFLASHAIRLPEQKAPVLDETYQFWRQQLLEISPDKSDTAIHRLTELAVSEFIGGLLTT